MLEINVKITVAQGEDYTPVESAVIQALSGTTAKAPAAAAEAQAAAAPAVPAEAPAAPAPKKAPTRSPKAAAPAKPSTTQAAVLEDDPAPADEPAAAEEAEEDLVGGPEPEVTYTVQDAVTRATAVVKEKDGRARIKVALAKASEAGSGVTYGKVGDMADDTAALGAFMTALEA